MSDIKRRIPETEAADRFGLARDYYPKLMSALGRWATLSMVIAFAGVVVGSSRATAALPTNAATIIRTVPADTDVGRFYASRRGELLWSRNKRLTPAAEVVIARLEAAASDGLTPSDYYPARLRADVEKARGGDAKVFASLDVALTNAAADFIVDLHGSHTSQLHVVDPSLQQPYRSRDDVFRALTRSSTPGIAWADATKMNPLYEALRLALTKLETTSGPNETALKVAANLARVRALPSDLGERYVLVNVAAATLRTVSDRTGGEGPTMRVVVGRPESPTPEIAGVIRYAVINPYWNVPEDMVRTQIARQVVEDGIDVIAKRRLEILTDWTPAAALMKPDTIAWRSVSRGALAPRVRQKPGPDNMMGRVKFMLPNDLGIYLHDTPDRSRFAPARRTFSAGCVRLEDAESLGAWLLDTPLDAFGAADDQRIDLVRPTPVYIVYLTVEVGDDGALTILPDVYGRDPPAA